MESRIQATSVVSDEQRMRRICELLSKAVVRDWASHVVGEDYRVPPVTDDGASESVEADGARIFAYLGLVGEASPAAIRETVGLARMRVYRALQPMLTAGRIVAKGHARAITYCLSPSESARISRN